MVLTLDQFMWEYNSSELDLDNLDIKKVEGFVYLITQKSTGMMYIGKKSFWCNKYFQKNGVKKKKRVESDWREYYGSSPRLQEEINRAGIDDFKREILYTCSTKSELSYLETYEILSRGALVRDCFFNDWVSCKITRAHLKKVASAVESRVVQ